MALSRYSCVLALSCLVGLFSSVRAQEAVPVDCGKGTEILEALEQELALSKVRQESFESIAADRFSVDLSREEAIPNAVTGEHVEQWPEELNCPSLQKDYQTKHQQLLSIRESLVRHERGWIDQPEDLEKIVDKLWESRQRLLRQGEPLNRHFANMPDSEAVLTTRMAVDRDQQQLSELRRDLFAILPSLNRRVSPAKITDLLALWRRSHPIELTGVPQAALESLPEDMGHMSQKYFQLAKLDLMVQRGALNDLRAWLWKNHKEEFSQVDERVTRGLMADEDRALRNRLEWLVLDTRLSYAPTDTDSARFSGWIKGLEYVLGFLAFPLLVVVARKLGALSARLQGMFAQWSRKRRLASQISRVTAGLPLLLPWLLGLFGLHLLHLIFTYYHQALLNSLVPLARLFILYGLVYLAGEWLLQRIALQAGSFLNHEQLQLVQRHARAAAAVAVLPLLLQDFVKIGIGPSALLDICHWFTIAGFLLAIGLLLRSRRQDFIDALKSVLPSQCDKAIETLLSERYFLLVAPIAAPPLLLALLGSFMHKALFDYDWYRKLFARSFKLRAAAVEASQPEVVSDSAALQDYQRWFLDEDAAAPFIDSGLYDSVRKSLDQWLEDKSCENSLMLTGARGSGKTSVLKRLHSAVIEEHPDVHVKVVEVPAKTTTEEAVLELLAGMLDMDLTSGPSALVRTDAERPPTLVVLDNAQNLFLRRVGGLIGWEALLSLTNARVENIFWLIVVNNQSWAYLSNIYGKEYQFRHIKTARAWSQNDIRSLILSRNHLSGYKIRYDDILLSTRGPEAGNIRNAEQLYFSLLWDACLGNPMLALRLWLTSIHLKGNTVVVGLPDEVSSAWLEQLSSDLHFVYAAIMIHENMTSDELVEATALPERVVRTALKTAYDAGIIQRSQERRYRIVPLWYSAIMKLLSRKNLLHE